MRSLPLLLGLGIFGLIRPDTTLAQGDTLSLYAANITVSHRHLLNDHGNITDQTTTEKNSRGSAMWVFDTVERHADTLHYYNSADPSHYFADVVYDHASHTIRHVLAVSGDSLTSAENVNDSYSYVDATGGTTTEDAYYLNVLIHRDELDTENVRLTLQTNSNGSGATINFDSRVFIHGQGDDTSFLRLKLTKSPMLSAQSSSEARPGFSASPNPASDHIRARGIDATKSDKLCLFGVLGREVCSVLLQPSATELEINVHDLPDGVYVLRIGEESLRVIVLH